MSMYFDTIILRDFLRRNKKNCIQKLVKIWVFVLYLAYKYSHLYVCDAVPDNYVTFDKLHARATNYVLLDSILYRYLT